MKSLYLIRHAKSSWADYSLPDDKRPLNKRGKRDAPLMAGILAGKSPGIEYILTSHAKRARKTAKYFREALNLDKGNVKKEPRFYHAAPEQILSLVNAIDLDSDIVAVVGHNPGMTDFVNQFSDGYIDNLPTCAIAQINYDVDQWKNVGLEKGKLVEIIYPKMFGLF